MHWISTLWRGLAIGVADVIPGVSGGTIALLTGVYERFIAALKQLTTLPVLLWAVITRKQAFSELREQLDVNFLTPLLFGIVVALAAASAIIPQLMSAYPAATFSFFAFLILSAGIGMLRAQHHTATTLLMLFAGIALGILIGILAPTQPEHTLVALLIAGALAISAMLLPGISGSAVLFILGHYEFMLRALHQPATYLNELLVFILGILLGIVCITRIITRLLTTAHTHTLSALTGLMLGTLILPLRSIQDTLAGSELSAILTGIIGLVLGVLLIRYGSQHSSENSTSQ